MPTYAKCRPTRFFGIIPPGDIRVSDCCVSYRMTAASDQRISVPAVATTGRMAYLRNEGRTASLVVRSFQPDPSGIYADGFQAFDPKTRSLAALGDPEADLPGNRFNDGKCDPRGRLWAGTMSIEEKPGQGTLYSLEPAGDIRRRLGDVTVSNGIVWTADESTMYFIDSPIRRIDAFDYDAASGDLTNRRCAIEAPAELGFPDGMAIDAAGMLWVGMWGGWHVVTFDPRTGCEVSRLRLPTANVTACAFGGPDLQDLYITTARVGLSPDELRRQPLAGDLFRVRTEAPGVRSTMYSG